MKIVEGTVIQATYRPDDLVPALWAELQRIDPSAAEAYQSGHPDINDVSSMDDVEKTDALDDLFILLSIRAPKGLYFGAHEGDGSDFGWWHYAE